MVQRRRFTAEEKVRILREHLDNGMKISDLSERLAVKRCSFCGNKEINL